MGDFFSDPLSDSLGHLSRKEHFHKVIALHEEPDLTWEFLNSQVPALPRGWYELSRLPASYRIEFTRDYWLSKIPNTLRDNENLERRIISFFDELEELGIYATQTSPGLPFDVHMVYGLKDAAAFFNGSPPASLDTINNLEKQFGTISFPRDYLNFLQIHDGFCKYTDTGLIKTRDMVKTYLKFQQLLGDEVIVAAQGQIINPSSLIPFYESYGLHCYQCFFTDWYEGEEMGNVFFSEQEKLMSNFLDANHLQENMAFPTFLDWLLFYLEDGDI